MSHTTAQIIAIPRDTPSTYDTKFKRRKRLTVFAVLLTLLSSGQPLKPTTMTPLTEEDILLIQKLKNRTYYNDSMSSSCSEEEKRQFDRIKAKLKEMAQFFADKYNFYGPFRCAANTGNPLLIGGKRLNTVWSGIFKGAKNKQYAAQISFIIDSDNLCLHVGFYFGRMSSHIQSDHTQTEVDNLRRISNEIASTLSTRNDLRVQYDSLAEYGYKAYHDKHEVTMERWLEVIKNEPEKCELEASLFPDEYGNIPYSLIDCYVWELLFLMSCFDSGKHITPVPPLSPADRFHQTEILTQIGKRGEQFVFDREREKLKHLGLQDENYPLLVSQVSDSFGYDILSKDEQGEELYIEVKTTTKKEGEYGANQFYLSGNEYRVSQKHKERYRLYRVYDINGSPHFTVLRDMDKWQLQPDGYIVNY